MGVRAWNYKKKVCFLFSLKQSSLGSIYEVQQLYLDILLHLQLISMLAQDFVQVCETHNGPKFQSDRNKASVPPGGRKKHVDYTLPTHCVFGENWGLNINRSCFFTALVHFGLIYFPIYE